MLDARRRIRAGVTGAADGAVSGLNPRLRLFGLLASLVPLFGGLQYLADETTPRVEVRLVAPATTPDAAAQAPAERVVERIVYVPVERSNTTPLNAARTSVATTERRAETTNATVLSGLDSANTALAQAAPTEPVEAPAVAEAAGADEPEDAPSEHMGLLALATPVPAPVAGPAVRSAPVVARAVAQPVAEPAEDEEVAEADTSDEDSAGDEVAEAPDDAETEHVEVAQVQVIDTTIEPDQSTRVVLYRVPARTTPEISPAKEDADAAAASPPEEAPAVADDADDTPSDDADTPSDDAEDTDAEPAAVDAKLVPPDELADDDQAVDEAAPDEDAPDDEAASDEADATAADEVDDEAVASDDADDAAVDADATPPNEAEERPQISVTVFATTNGTFVSEDDSGQ
jgi:hypothetical protein